MPMRLIQLIVVMLLSRPVDDLLTLLTSPAPILFIDVQHHLDGMFT